MAALDLALDRMATQMRKAADRRKVHRGHHTPQSLHSAMADATPQPDPAPGVSAETAQAGPLSVDGDGPLVVREKTHTAAPMSLDQALYEMELVGHDFFLFVDSETKLPSVVYRRHAYDYGVIHLEADPLAESEPQGAGGALGA